MAELDVIYSWAFDSLEIARCGSLNTALRRRLKSLSDPRLFLIAVICALVAALGLVGCGRKGGLDPPPGVTADLGAAAAPEAEPTVAPGGTALPRPREPLPRSTPIDRLID